MEDALVEISTTAGAIECHGRYYELKDNKFLSRIQLRWTLSDCASLPHDVGHIIQSPYCEGWCISASLGGCSEKYRDWVGLFITPLGPVQNADVSIHFRMGNGIVIKGTTFACDTQGKAVGKGQSQVMRRATFVQDHEDLNNTPAIIEAECCTWCDTGQILSFLNVGTDLGAMLQSGNFTDVEIRARDGSIRAHKAVLAARSPIFAAMFKSPMAESKENVLQLLDVPLWMVEMMVNFMYTGWYPTLMPSLPLSSSSSSSPPLPLYKLLNWPGSLPFGPNEIVTQKESKEAKGDTKGDLHSSTRSVTQGYTSDPSYPSRVHLQLLQMADRFQVASLKSMSVVRLATSLSPECLVDSYLMADKLSLDGLKKSCVDFIGGNLARLTAAIQCDTCSKMTTLDLMDLIVALTPGAIRRPTPKTDKTDKQDQTPHSDHDHDDVHSLDGE